MKLATNIDKLTPKQEKLLDSIESKLNVDDLVYRCKDESLNEDDNVRIPKIPKWWRIIDTLGHPFRFENGNYFYTVKDVKNYFPEAVKIKVIEYFSDEEIKEKPWLVKQYYKHLNEDDDIHVGETPEGDDSYVAAEVVVEFFKRNIDEILTCDDIGEFLDTRYEELMEKVSEDYGTDKDGDVVYSLVEYVLY